MAITIQINPRRAREYGMRSFASDQEIRRLEIERLEKQKQPAHKEPFSFISLVLDIATGASGGAQQGAFILAIFFFVNYGLVSLFS